MSNQNVYTTRRALNGEAIRSVRRDRAGNWHIHEREVTFAHGAVQSTLDAVLKLHPSLAEVLNLCPGAGASRSVGGHWVAIAPRIARARLRRIVNAHAPGRTA